jgi:3-deoxy-D-manno-octulosonic-acid transferase
LSSERREELQREWALSPDAPVVVFGSTHPGEEELAIKAFLELRRELPDLTMVVCPRHPERFQDVWRLCREGLGDEEFSLGRASEPETLTDGAVDFLLLDKMGVLSEAYGLGALAVMGGSFAPIGGHNLMEPAAHGVPVVCGPHMKAQRELVRLMSEADAFVQASAEDLAPSLARLLKDAAERGALSQRCLRAAEAHRGASRRCFEEIDRRELLSFALEN